MSNDLKATMAHHNNEGAAVWRPPSLAVLAEFLERVLPGKSGRVVLLRQQMLEFGLNPTARALLLLGPIGAGKSTIARCVALLKRVALMTPEHAKDFLSLARFSGPNQLDVNYLASWYIELPLTGLVESLADVQLFGSTKTAYTNAGERPGVFESASTGQMPSNDKSVAAAVTGGIVFLDEVGDLPASLQAKLLPVLSGGIFYRLGTEGRKDAALHFDGVIITASWKRLDDGRLRPDLLSRIAPYVIDVPGVDDRIEDFELLVDDIERATIARLRNTIEEMLKADPKQLDRDYWRRRIDSISGLNRAQRDALKAVPWGKHGNLRGLTAAIEQLIGTGTDVQSVVSRLPKLVQGPEENAIGGTGLLKRLLARNATGEGLAAHLRAIELDDRRLVQTVLQGDPKALQCLADTLGIDASRVRAQLRTIARERRARDRDA